MLTILAPMLADLTAAHQQARAASDTAYAVYAPFGAAATAARLTWEADPTPARFTAWMTALDAARPHFDTWMAALMAARAAWDAYDAAFRALWPEED